jgi:hypothetical protein
MVASYGMSDKIGTVSFESGHDEVFIGRTMTQGRSYSEAVAAQIDEEVKALVGRAYARCQAILEASRDKLETVASYLLEHETMEQEDFLAVFGEAPGRKTPVREYAAGAAGSFRRRFSAARAPGGIRARQRKRLRNGKKPSFLKGAARQNYQNGCL